MMSKWRTSRGNAVAANIQEALDGEGLPGVVRYLNAKVPHRYTGMFLKDGPLLVNVALFDKQVPNPPLWEPFPVEDSFCSVVIASGHPLTIHEAVHDSRSEVMRHNAAKIVQAYCGIPLLDAEGVTRGTLCHFDEQALDFEVDLNSLLQVPSVVLPLILREWKREPLH